MKAIYSYFKRIMDLILSLILLILLSPVFLILALAIKIDSPGPVLYKQTRTGKDGHDFKLLKFRSMSKDNDVYNFKEKDKITKVGKFIRKTSLDELPQLINIIKGDMSFIGPRPWLSECYNYFTPYQKQRNLVRPGITGYAQVSGRKDLNILKRIEYDVEYASNVSFYFDLVILLKTIKVVCNSSDNTRDNYTIKDEFMDLKYNYLNYKEIKENR